MTPLMLCLVTRPVDVTAGPRVVRALHCRLTPAFIQKKYAAVEICVGPIVWRRCTDVSSFSAQGALPG